MLEKSCKEFAEILSSKAPVPGGGGASAYVGCLGMALGSMVGNLTLGKKKYAQVQDDIADLLIKSQLIMERLEMLVAEDAAAFKPLAEAYGLPANTDEEKAEKNRVIQQALVAAAQSPMDIARACVEAIKLHLEYGHKGSRLAISDVGCGVMFCKSALQGARLNVLINLKLMENQELKQKMQHEIDDLTKEGISLADEIYAYVESLL